MKDSTHHLKHVQKKVLQSVRKENGEYINHNNSPQALEYQSISPKKRRKALNRLRHTMGSSL